MPTSDDDYDDNDDDAYHFHGIPYRKQLFENIWRDDIVDRKTWFTIKHFFSSIFFLVFATFEYMFNVYSLRSFFFLLPLLNSLWFFTLKETNKNYGHYCCFFVIFLFYLIWCEHKISKHVQRLLFIYFYFWTREKK